MSQTRTPSNCVHAAAEPGGGVKAEGRGDGYTTFQERHRQAALDAATQDLLRIPEHIKVQSIIAVGYPAERREPLSAEDLKYWKVRANTCNKWHALGQEPVTGDNSSAGLQ